jgi:hypothetical protein
MDEIMKRMQEENCELKATLNNERACSVFSTEANAAIGQMLYIEKTDALVSKTKSPRHMTEEDEVEFNSVKKMNRHEAESSYFSKRCRNLEKALLENIKVNRVLELENKSLQEIIYDKDIRNADPNMSGDSLLRAESTSQLTAKRRPKFRREDTSVDSQHKKDRKYNCSGLFEEIKKNTKYSTDKFFFEENKERTNFNSTMPSSDNNKLTNYDD